VAGCSGGTNEASKDGIEIEPPIKPVLDIGEIAMGVFAALCRFEWNLTS